jgi:hypothetical protein
LKAGLDPIEHGGPNGTGEVDLAIERGQELNCQQPPIVFNDLASVAHKFVSQVLKSVTKLLEAAAGLRVDPASDYGLPLKRRSIHQEREMTLLHCQPLIFHDGKILTGFRMSVFDITQ